MRQRIQERFATVAEAPEQEGLVDGSVRVSDYDPSEERSFSHGEGAKEESAQTMRSPGHLTGFHRRTEHLTEPARGVLAVA